ncbi:hypothetical protein [Bosea beijingensis]|uniref:hypothetical protein n=1 Tax=Bosea beijingensis TaxID=3068632 RepID=UPI0027405738|nr:hypothetical protein [Bosea sp. REN20]
MKRLVPALLAALLMSGGAYAQSINVGPGGVSVDTRSPRERAIDREIREERRDRYDRRREREWRRASSRRDCRTVTTERETRRGVVRRTTRVCD